MKNNLEVEYIFLAPWLWLLNKKSIKFKANYKVNLSQVAKLGLVKVKIELYLR